MIRTKNWKGILGRFKRGRECRNLLRYEDRVGSIRVALRDLLRGWFLGSKKQFFGLGFGNQNDFVYVGF